MIYGNMFQLLLSQLSEGDGWVLQMVHDTGGGRLAELRSKLSNARVFYVKQRLRELEDLGLVVCIDEVWKATWTGAGVSNWRTQLLCAEQGKAVEEPREGENGELPGPECKEYRAALFAPGFCWCGRAQREHVGEAVRVSCKLLRR
ncbi:MAG: hypothetical protein KIS61_00305 [Candidatus Eremiobacteraeota bacterium]|jgi:hypothetical protein|nr:hypothetical protein [Candidatus Eremiobacteraeota bacterium]